MSFDSILAAFRNRRETHGSEATARKYASHVQEWQEWLTESQDTTIWDAEPADLRLFIEELTHEDYAPSTIEQRVSGISKFYQDLEILAETHDVPAVPPNPYDGLDSETKQLLRGSTKKKDGLTGTEEYPYLQPEEVTTLYENVPSPRLRNELVVKLLYNCGLRREELAKIKLEHLDREDRTIYIPARKSPNPRVVSFNEGYVGFQLEQWLETDRRSMVYANESDYLLPTNDSPHISGRQINSIVKKAAEKAGLQETIAEFADGRPIHKVTPHTLRHSYAIQMLKSGVDVRTLQQLMGHEKIDTTLVYLQQSTDDMLEESRQFVPE